ncbi:MAG: hypothetical protein ACRDZ8_02575, partial [Acidimicrobiales bacterium]
ICLYPEFGSLLSPVESAVDPVLAAVPGRPGAALTIAQTVQLGLDLTLTHGQSAAQVAQWKTQLQQAPGASPSGSALYLVVGSWPVGGQVVAARFDVALGAADWAVGLPVSYSDPNQACVAFDQAREAIAIWLAIQAIHPPPNDLRSGLSTGGRATPGSGSGSGPGPGSGGPPGRLNLLNVDNQPIFAWTYPGESSSYLAFPLLQTTEAGDLLAQTMAALPREKVISVLDGNWAKWTNWQTSDAALAAALGVQAPAVPAPTYRTQTGQVLPLPLAPGPSQPICTS